MVCLAVVKIGGLVTSTLFTLLALPAFYALAHELASATAHPKFRGAGKFIRGETGASNP